MSLTLNTSLVQDATIVIIKNDSVLAKGHISSNGTIDYINGDWPFMDFSWGYGPVDKPSVHFGHEYYEYHPVHATVVFAFASIYLLMALMILSMCYYVPAVELISAVYKINKNVTGSIIMAVSSDLPQLFFNFIGDMVDESQSGISAVLFSAMIQIMLIPFLCGVTLKRGVQLEKKSIIRDLVFIVIACCNFVVMSEFGAVSWHLSLICVLLYACYFCLMVFEVKCTSEEKSIAESVTSEPTESSQIINDDVSSTHDSRSSIASTSSTSITSYMENNDELQEDVSYEENWNLMQRPKNIFLFIIWMISLPIIIVYHLTIPGYLTKICGKRMFLITILMSMIYMGILSYGLLNIMDTLIESIKINRVLSSMIFLGFGACFPDIMNSYISAKRGNLDIAISNGLGGVVFDMTFVVGLPLLIYNIAFQKSFALNNYMLFTVIIIISAMVMLILFCSTKFILSRFLSFAFLGGFLICNVVTLFILIKQTKTFHS